jgi:probable rRNA maturation factor
MRRGARVEVTRGVRAWSPRLAELTAWTCAALGRRADGAELALRVVGTAESRRLNAQFRGRDAPTNVLSFPAAKWRASPSARARPLGDLVICARLLRSEARLQGKTLRAHWAHLVVHGALHLIGYDHEVARDARRMQRREIAVLRRLGFANPYRSA